jgi:hypothetical protein
MSIISGTKPYARTETASLANLAGAEFQRRLKPLYEYLDSCDLTLGQIRNDLSEYKANPASGECLKRAAARLGEFCIDADSWGFDTIYDVAQGVQTLLLDSAEQFPAENLMDALNRGLNLLSVLLQRCEGDFQLKLAVGETIKYMKQAGQ